MTDQLEIESQWYEVYRRRHPELTEPTLRQLAQAASLSGFGPTDAQQTMAPAAPPRPQPSFTLPFWARMGLALGGRKMLGRMLGNKITTGIGILLATIIAAAKAGLLPDAVTANLTTIIGIAGALGLIAAKDATVGSEPGATH